VNITLTPMVVNKCVDSVPDIVTAPHEGYLADAIEYAARRSAAQNEATDLLRRSRDGEFFVLPRTNLTGESLVDTLAESLAACIGQLP
jgi:hypothetical protein